MVSSIQISEETKEELFLIKARLELATGQKCTLEDAIKWLLKKERKKSFEERKRMSEKLFGIAPNISIADVSELRRQRSSRFENL